VIARRSRSYTRAMPIASVLDSRAGRLYFAVQALAGAGWWVGVAMSGSIRSLTLGGLDPVPVAIFDIPLFAIASALIACGVRPLVWVVVPWTALVATAMTVYATLTGLAGWGALLMIAAAAGSLAAGGLVRLGRLPTEWLLVGPFAVRLAPTGSAAAHLLRTAMQIVVFWGLFLVVIPIVIVFFENRWGLHLELPDSVRWSGLWSAAAMSTRGEGTPLPSATARRLVIAGPYRFVRNPMAVAGIAQGVAVGLMAGSWLVVVYALCGSLVWNAIIRPLEEADLAARFGDAYAEYAQAVGCWMPRLRPYDAAGVNIQ